MRKHYEWLEEHIKSTEKFILVLQKNVAETKALLKEYKEREAKP